MEVEICSQPLYESGSLGNVTGGLLRPGGLDLTRQMVKLCDLPHTATILDVGSGSGCTVELLREDGHHAIGMDRSNVLIKQGKARRPDLPLSCALGSSLPISSGVVDAIITECSISAMTALNTLLAEFRRVLCPAGRLAISDLYFRNPQKSPDLKFLPACCGLGEIRTQADLEESLLAHGFRVLVWEDHSDKLKYLVAQLIFSHDSMENFWKQSEPDSDPREIQTALRKAELGYFLLVAEKDPIV